MWWLRLVWWLHARSYRRLASAQCAVAAEPELRLPALAYSSAEWGTALPLYAAHADFGSLSGFFFVPSSCRGHGMLG